MKKYLVRAFMIGGVGIVNSGLQWAIPWATGREFPVPIFGGGVTPIVMLSASHHLVFAAATVWLLVTLLQFLWVALPMR